MEQLKEQLEALLRVEDFTCTPVEHRFPETGKVQQTTEISISGGVRMALSICNFLNDNKQEVIERCRKDAELELLAAQETALKEAQDLIKVLTPQIAAAKMAMQVLTPT